MDGSPIESAARVVYVREDHLLAELAVRLADRGLDSYPVSRDPSPWGVGDANAIVAFLRDNELMIVCDGKKWTPGVDLSDEAFDVMT